MTHIRAELRVGSQVVMNGVHAGMLIEGDRALGWFNMEDPIMRAVNEASDVCDFARQFTAKPVMVPDIMLRDDSVVLVPYAHPLGGVRL